MEEKREGVRLNRYLAETGLCSRREADRMIESGQVRVDGRVGVLGDRALPAVEIVPAVKEFDYPAKYQTGGAREICPAPITPEQQAEMGALALKLHRTLGLEVYSRTDFLLDDDGKFWCLEVNSLPGMTAASLVPKEAAAIGMTYNELCEEIVRLSYPIKRRG